MGDIQRQAFPTLPAVDGPVDAGSVQAGRGENNTAGVGMVVDIPDRLGRLRGCRPGFPPSTDLRIPFSEWKYRIRLSAASMTIYPPAADVFSLRQCLPLIGGFKDRAAAIQAIRRARAGAQRLRIGRTRHQPG
jgi:hypothetical protein